MPEFFSGPFVGRLPAVAVEGRAATAAHFVTLISAYASEGLRYAKNEGTLLWLADHTDATLYFLFIHFEQKILSLNFKIT